MLRVCLLVLLLATLGLAQSADMQQLQDLRSALQQARGQSGGLEAERQTLLARFELLEVQAAGLQSGQGDWDTFFRFYETTAEVADSRPLPGPLQGGWGRIQALMKDLARRHGRTLVEVAPTQAAPSGSVAVGPEMFRRALQALVQIQQRLAGPPPGGNAQRYEQARQQLAQLGQDLQTGMEMLQQGRGLPGYAQLLRDRRRYWLTRSALELPANAFWELDQLLDQMPGALP